MKTCVYIWLVLVWFVEGMRGGGGVFCFFKDTFPSVVEERQEMR